MFSLPLSLSPRQVFFFFFSISSQPLEDSSPRFFCFSFPDPRTCALNASSSSGLILPGPEKVFVEVGRSVGVGEVVPPPPSFSSPLLQGLSEARLLFSLGGGVENKLGSFWCCCCCCCCCW